jgi:hypothetical protein
MLAESWLVIRIPQCTPVSGCQTIQELNCVRSMECLDQTDHPVDLSEHLTLGELELLELLSTINSSAEIIMRLAMFEPRLGTD